MSSEKAAEQAPLYAPQEVPLGDNAITSGGKSNPQRLKLSALVFALILGGCTNIPFRQDTSQLQTAVSQAGTGAPRLPAANEQYLDPAWFNQSLSAERAIQAALLNNPRVRAELTRLDAAQAERVQAGLLLNPMLSLMAMRPEGGGRYELNYNLMQSLFDLLTRSRRIAMADASQQRVEAEVLMQLVTLAQDTEAAYYEALVAAELLRVHREQLVLEQQCLLLLQRQAQQGALMSSVVLEQQAVLAMRAHEVRTAEAALVQARASLGQQLGLPSAKSLQLPEHLPAFAMPALDEPALQALAMQHRAELNAAVAAVQQARAESTLQTGALRATEPSAGPVGMRESDGTSFLGPGVQITLPIFDTGRARRDLANAQLAQTEFSSESVRRQIPLEVERALATLIAAQQAAGHADHHLHQQQQLEQLALRTYQQGAVDYPRYRDAKRNRLIAEMERVQAQLTLRSAAVELQRATGVAAIAR